MSGLHYSHNSARKKHSSEVNSMAYKRNHQPLTYTSIVESVQYSGRLVAQHPEFIQAQGAYKSLEHDEQDLIDTILTNLAKIDFDIEIVVAVAKTIVQEMVKETLDHLMETLTSIIVTLFRAYHNSLESA